MSKSSLVFMVLLCICMCNISRAELKRHRKGKHASLYYNSLKTASLQENRADTDRTENRARPVILVGMMVSDTESAQKNWSAQKKLNKLYREEKFQMWNQAFLFLWAFCISSTCLRAWHHSRKLSGKYWCWKISRMDQMGSRLVQNTHQICRPSQRGDKDGLRHCS